ncbi:TetR family transcriptional regulator [Humibacillus sp. DSM 29435]|uniref:TetR/AcrR family transcriptional regulator n=1 Tax=Humibacillus sp. DSM 29435 TaxID=1869167 RepID=UPI0008727A9E|nr:TetR/AcrR family transcriptional regulator [Humibacillus sp. DSM 29435]OFE14414.1 TetR family transcriptional regulator [Humibacillus sp. DSM 29435]
MDISGQGSSAAGPTPRVAARDGRDSRWQPHREQRRKSLVDATIKAIRRHGATVGLDDIAAEAGTSRTVIYRHFDDKAGLYRAVAQRIDARVVGDVSAALLASNTTPPDPRTLISSTVEAYLSLVESDTEVYRFVVNRPLVDRPLADDPVEGTAGQVADQLTDHLTRALRGSLGGHDIRHGIHGDALYCRARVWAVALVGSVQAVADDWLAASDRLPRDELVETLTDLAWHGLAPQLTLQTESPPPRPWSAHPE